MKKLLFLTLLVTNVLFALASMRVGILMPFRAEQDQTFGYMVKKGVDEFSKKNPDVEIRYVYPASDISFESYVKYFAIGFDVVLCVGYMYSPAVMNVAKKNPDKKFIIIDNVVDLPNVVSVIFDDYMAAYLAGEKVQKMFPKSKIGFIAANPSFLMDNFYFGFSNGISEADGELNLTREYISNDITGFSSQNRAEFIAEELYSKGVDVILAPIGSSSIGVLRAAKKFNKEIVGIDRNFNEISDSNVAFSIVKRVDRALVEVLSKAVKKTVKWRTTINYDFENGGYEIK